MLTEWEQLRREFPALSEWTYLNTATFGQMPRRAAEAVARHFARRDEFACNDFIQWFDDADGIRARVAAFIGCQAADIAFIHNASAGLSLLMGGLEWKAGDRIVTLEDEFPNHFYYASHLGSRGVEFVETAWERFYDALTPATRLVAISTVNYSTGFRPPVAEIAAELRRRESCSTWMARRVWARCSSMYQRFSRICLRWTLISGCSRPTVLLSCT